ncbi:MAG: hypothetical protein JWN70_7148 [Planctomycetaceae bacterium]|nr:hypothetical protein [Planctomycetaceae bacterium]
MHVLPKRRRPNPILSIENLEIRNLLSGIMSANLPAAVPETEPNETLDQATDLGSTGSAVVDGSIDQNGIDVDWYCFTLLTSSEITLDSTSGTLGLYNSAGLDPGDHQNPGGYRLLAQNSAGDSMGASITRTLAAGTYYVAISGQGNSYFYPFLEDSGVAGETGDYTLVFASEALTDPVVGDPAPLSVDVSPVEVRIDFAGTLNFTPTVVLTDAGGDAIPLAWTNVNSTISELQFAPNKALTPGDYTAVLKDSTGTVRITLQVHLASSADVPIDLGDDIAAAAIDLGELDESGLLQIPGMIGDDAYYDVSSQSAAQRPGADVDLYHFHIGTTSPVGLVAEVFAGRLGSPLDAGLSLYRMNAVSGQLELVTGNNQSFNSIKSTNLQHPLFNDPIITSGLVAGDYYVAVSSGLNTPSPAEHQSGGSGSGIFDPNQSHSGAVGTSTGRYVLSLRAEFDPLPAEVVSVSIADQSTLQSAPTTLDIQFNGYVNVAELAHISNFQTSQNTIPGIYIADQQGHSYIPHFISFDPTTFTARFLLSDRLPSGGYQLHIDGSEGLANIAGVPLEANASSIVHFTVSTPAAGTAGNPTIWTHDSQTDTTPAAQALGVLFPDELQSGVEIVRAAGSGSSRTNDQSDEYSFEVLKTGRYRLAISGHGLPSGVPFQILDQQGHVVDMASTDDGLMAFIFLKAGSYVLHVGNWPAATARSVGYQINIDSSFHADDAAPLSSGPAAAVGLRLITAIDTGGTGGSGGSGSGGLGSGMGSIGGGNNGGGSSGGGSSNLGGTSAATRLNDSPNDYNARFGLPRLSLPSNLDGLVIAMPTVLSDSGTGLGARLQVARSLRRISDLGAGLPLGRLSEFADGPLGRARGDQSDLTSGLSTVRRLSRLIDSSLQSDRDTIGNQQAQPTNTSTQRNETTIATDRETDSAQHGELGPATAPGDGAPEQPDSNYTTGTEPKRSSLNAKVHSVSHFRELPGVLSQTENDSVFLPSGPSRDDATQVETAELQSAYLPDTVFATGMGLLVASAALHRRRQTGSLNSLGTDLYFTSTESVSTSKKKVHRS